MAKRRKRRKRRPVPHIPADTDKLVPGSRRFGKITDPERLLSLRHKNTPRNIRSEQHLMKTHRLGTSTIKQMAEWVIKNHACDFHKAAEERTRDFTWNWAQCQEIYDNFSYEKVGTIHLYQGTFRDNNEIKKDFFLYDGVHRCVSLTCLLLQDKIEFQPLRCEIDFYGDDADHR